MQKLRIKKQKDRLLSWLLVFLCILAIFLIVPVARTIQKYVSSHWGASLFGYAVLLTVSGIFIYLLLYLFFRMKIRRISNYLWLLLVTTLYVYFTLQLWDVPVEAIHFLEYGLLGFLLFRALKFDIKDLSLYIIAFLMGSLVGIFDEILQWIVPLRLWDIRDVGLNALSCGLFQLGLWKGIWPGGISAKIKPKSWKILSLMLGVNLIFLGLCLSNTPQRVSAYTERFTKFSFLNKEEPMNRFRHVHKDPEVGTFHSLLSPADLKKEDTLRATQNAQILKNWKSKDFRKFRRSFQPLRHPFLYELRFHLEIRDKNFSLALQTENRDLQKKLYLAAYKENLILERYFGNTLQKASYSKEKDWLPAEESLINKNTPYTSPISFGPIFPWSEKTMWLLILITLAILTLSNIIYSRIR